MYLDLKTDGLSLDQGTQKEREVRLSLSYTCLHTYASSACLHLLCLSSVSARPIAFSSPTLALVLRLHQELATKLAKETYSGAMVCMLMLLAHARASAFYACK